MLLLSGYLLPCLAFAAPVKQQIIESVRLDEEPPAIRITLSAKAAYKIIRVAQDQFFIAFKGFSPAKDFFQKGAMASHAEFFQVKKLPQDVTAIVFGNGREVKEIASQWGKNRRELVVRFTQEKNQRYHKTARRDLKQKSGRQDSPQHAEVAASKPQTASKPIERAVSEVSENKRPSASPPPPKKKDLIRGNRLIGGIDDFLPVLRENECKKEETIDKVIQYCRKKLYLDAIIMLDGYLETSISPQCLEHATFLRVYAAFKKSEQANEIELLQTVRLIQDAITYFPESTYTPYSMMALGKIYTRLNNTPEAKGYYQIILDQFASFSGTPEVLYELGILEVKKKAYGEASKHFARLVREYPDSLFVKDATLELGKAYFETNNYSQALEQFNALLDANPQMKYSSPDLLLYIANSYYHTRRYQQARELLSKAYNLWPQLESADIVLTRIGDTYADDDQIEKARSIYKLATEKYPGTDGFVISSMRLAKLATEDAEKETLYTMIITDHPDHPMASLARLKLAEIQQQAGQYESAIATINQLLQENTRALRREALFIKEASFEALFNQLMEKENYPRLLEIYEKERRSFRRFQSPTLFYIVGHSYFQSHLYAQAASALEKSDTYYDPSKKPDDLFFELGASLQETGKQDTALEWLEEYVRRQPRGKNAVESFMRLGRIWMERKEFGKARGVLQRAMALTTSEENRAEILLLAAEASNGLEDFQQESADLIKAINIYAASPEDSSGEIFSSYKKLGDSYSRQKLFLKAAEAYSMAIQFVRTEENPIDLKYALADSYYKGNASRKAVKVFQDIIDAGDPFWGKLAEEKLRGIRIEERLNNS